MQKEISNEEKLDNLMMKLSGENKNQKKRKEFLEDNTKNKKREKKDFLSITEDDLKNRNTEISSF